MIEIIIHVSAEDFARLEDAVFEVEDATRWNLFEDFANKGYRAQGIFDTEEQARAAWAELSEAGEVVGDASIRELRDSDWKDSYKEHFKPWTIGNLHWVPVWLKDEYKLPEGHHAVWLDPGMAFGTGNHETTRLCVERLIEVPPAAAGKEAMSVVDAGTGSGILAISAAKLGYTQVYAFDNDEEAVRIACENAVLNDEEMLHFDVGDLTTGFTHQPYDIVIANILAPVLIDFREPLNAALKDDGTMILSGILTKEAEGVKSAFAELRNWKSIDLHELGEWTSVTLKA